MCKVTVGVTLILGVWCFVVNNCDYHACNNETLPELRSSGTLTYVRHLNLVQHVVLYVHNKAKMFIFNVKFSYSQHVQRPLINLPCYRQQLISLHEMVN